MGALSKNLGLEALKSNFEEKQAQTQQKTIPQNPGNIVNQAIQPNQNQPQPGGSNQKIMTGTKASLTYLNNYNKTVANKAQNIARKSLGLNATKSNLSESALLKLQKTLKIIEENIEQSSITYKRNKVDPIVNPYTKKKGAKKSAVKQGIINKVASSKKPLSLPNGRLNVGYNTIGGKRELRLKYKQASKLLSNQQENQNK